MLYKVLAFVSYGVVELILYLYFDMSLVIFPIQKNNKMSDIEIVSNSNNINKIKELHCNNINNVNKSQDNNIYLVNKSDSININKDSEIEPIH